MTKPDNSCPRTRNSIFCHGPITRSELEKRLNLSPTTIAVNIKKLVRAGLIHVCRWDHDPTGRQWVEVWKWGPGENQPRPKSARSDPTLILAKRSARIEQRSLKEKPVTDRQALLAARAEMRREQRRASLSTTPVVPQPWHPTGPMADGLLLQSTMGKFCTSKGEDE